MQDLSYFAPYHIPQTLRPIYMIPTYTAMLELRETLIKHCGGDEFWV